MTPERAKELLPIIQAFAEGKEVEVFAEGHGWYVVAKPEWFDTHQYRIKPETKVIQVTYRLGLFKSILNQGTYYVGVATSYEQERMLSSCSNFVRWISSTGTVTISI